MRRACTFGLFLCGVLALGCDGGGDDTTGTDSATGETGTETGETGTETGETAGPSCVETEPVTCDAAGSICLQATVPGDFDATVTGLTLGIYPAGSTFPPTEPPKAVSVSSIVPCATAGGTIHAQFTDLNYTQLGLPADQAVLYLALLVEGGGMGSPVSGVDYQAIVTADIDADGNAVNVTEPAPLMLVP